MKITEKSVQNSIKQLLCSAGWRVLRAPISVYTGKDIAWPDLVAVKAGCVLWIECKNPERSVWSQKQQNFAQLVSDAGCIYVLAKNVEIIEDTIKRLFYDFTKKKWDLEAKE